MTLFERFWSKAKIGTKLRLGPLTLHLRVAKSVSVTRNWPRAPLLGDTSVRLGGLLPASIGADMPPLGQIDGPVENMAHRSEVALIVGTGPGLGSALARRFAKAGMVVAMAARNTKKLEGLIQEIQTLGGYARAYGCDATEERSVKSLLKLVTKEMGFPDLVVYNVEHFIPGTITEIETPAFEECWRATTLGGFLVGRETARFMVPRGSGTIIYTGATGALRGRAEYINMAVGKFGIRALAQSMARDLGPKGIHVAHVILDGGILSPHSGEGARERASAMFPEHIAESCYHLHIQHRSTWTQELDLRPWVEKF
jgi:NAD(P)-dependent dehydrogenase (short-subunit alcohol dehydrogenase family)